MLRTAIPVPLYVTYFTSLQVLFGLPLGLAPSLSYSIHFFTQSLSSFRNRCPYHRNLFSCSTEIMSPIPTLSLDSSWNSIFHLNITYRSDHLIFTRDSIYAIARICHGNSVCLSVCMSVTRVDQSKTDHAIFTIQ